MPPRSSPCMKPNAQLAHTYTHADGMEKRNGLGKGFTIFPFTSFVRSLGEVCGCILLSHLPILSRGFGYRVSMYLSSRILHRHDKQPCVCHHMVLKPAWKSVDHSWSIHQAKRKQMKTAVPAWPICTFPSLFEYHMMTHTGFLSCLCDIHAILSWSNMAAWILPQAWESNNSLIGSKSDLL